jgi:hypothetical protein
MVMRDYQPVNNATYGFASLSETTHLTSSARSVKG